MNGVPISIDSIISDITIDAQNGITWNPELYHKQLEQLVALSAIGEGEWIEEVKGNSKIVCLLRIGDDVIIDKGYGGGIGGKKTKIKEIERGFNCESGFMCNTELFPHQFLDANWYIPNPPSLNTNK